MVRIASALLASLVLSACVLQGGGGAPGVSEALRKEFAPSGTLLAGTNYGNPVIVQRHPSGGDPQGVGPELARELARRLGVPIRYVTYDSAGAMAAAGKNGAWDIAFFAVDPVRAEEFAFSAPYVNIDGTYLVRAESPLRRLEDFDRKGVKISVGDKSAYDLWLTRNVKQVELVRVPTSQGAIDEFLAGRTDAVAGVKQPLVTTAARVPGLRVIDGAFMTIGQASAVPKARTNAAAYLRAYIEEMKASGFVANHIARTGVSAAVAPAAR